ncbi:uncharacterized protein M421DRAFT_426021 [Didymella exigua CBS 183.55]|uniref:Cytochrome b5 heme-binding domain-containing protein n=1 Tax=Didymella exigua CBS 183.55 TaxID=1150837 RepID=A0A6A5R7N3_9PLEO|nr:uncharacterized protein M421DRAFT_426021 [Didymella exigua CBS 183.55]KAF1923210.1 hypothetical protein M421DRAFT_426021 [Didymella exigua CBS 183.55]
MSTPARYRKPGTITAATSTPTASHEDTAPIPRASASTTEAKKELKAAFNEQAVKTSKGLSVLDVLRVLGGLALLSAGLSYLSTSGESMTWGYNAKWTRMREWKNVLRGQVQLTDIELTSYDGSDPTKPIYLALNGTIYDVSASPQTYGPGGSYHFFAGRDAARAFLTGCFVEDAIPDLRGVERMFIPVDPEEKADAAPDAVEKARARRQLTPAELKNRRAQETRLARQKMVQGLESWHALFRGDKGKPYFKAGVVSRPQGWEKYLPERPLCEQAEKSRPVRKYD